MLNFQYLGLSKFKDKNNSDSTTFVIPASEITNFFREIQLSINIFRGIQDQYRIEAVLPKSLRAVDLTRPSFEDCCILIDILRETSRYAEENKEHLGLSNIDLLSLLRTTMSVNDGDVSITTHNEDFKKHINLYCKSKNYHI